MSKKNTHTQYVNLSPTQFVDQLKYIWDETIKNKSISDTSRRIVHDVGHDNRLDSVNFQNVTLQKDTIYLTKFLISHFGLK